MTTDMPGRYHCAALHCTNNSVKRDKDPNLQHVKFYSVPQKSPMRSLWLKMINRENYDPRRASVCSVHFLDGHGPTEELPFPTLFQYNNFKGPQIKKSADVTDCELTAPYVPPPTSTEWKRKKRVRKCLQNQEDGTKKRQDKMKVPKMTVPIILTEEEIMEATNVPRHYRSRKNKKSLLTGAPVTSGTSVLDGSQATPKDPTTATAAAAAASSSLAAESAISTALVSATKTVALTSTSVGKPKTILVLDSTGKPIGSNFVGPMSLANIGQFSGLRSIVQLNSKCSSLLTNTSLVTSKGVNVSAMSNAGVSLSGTPIGTQPSGIGLHVLASSCGSNLTSSAPVNLVVSAPLLKPRSILTSSSMALANGRPCLISHPAPFPVRTSLGTSLILPGNTLAPRAPGSLIIRPTSHPKGTRQIPKTLPSKPSVTASTNVTNILAKMGAKTVTVSGKTGTQKILLINPGDATKVPPQATFIPVTPDQHTDPSLQKWRVVNGQLVAVEKKLSSQSCETASSLAQEIKTETGDGGRPSKRMDGGVIVIEPDGSNVSYEALNGDVKKEEDKICFHHFEELPKDPKDSKEVEMIGTCDIPTVAPITIAPCGEKSETTELKSEEHSVKKTSNLSLTSLLGTAHYSKATNNTLSSIIGVKSPIENLTVSKKSSINTNCKNPVGITVLVRRSGKSTLVLHNKELTIALQQFINEKKLAYQLSHPEWEDAEIIKKLTKEFWSLSNEQKEVYKRLADDARLNGPEACYNLGFEAYIKDAMVKLKEQYPNVQQLLQVVGKEWLELPKHEKEIWMKKYHKETSPPEKVSTDIVTERASDDPQVQASPETTDKKHGLGWSMFMTEMSRTKYGHVKNVRVRWNLISSAWMGLSKSEKNEWHERSVHLSSPVTETTPTSSVSNPISSSDKKKQRRKLKPASRDYGPGPYYQLFVKAKYRESREDIAKEEGVDISEVKLPAIMSRMSKLWKSMDEEKKEVYRQLLIEKQVQEHEAAGDVAKNIPEKIEQKEQKIRLKQKRSLSVPIEKKAKKLKKDGTRPVKKAGCYFQTFVKEQYNDVREGIAHERDMNPKHVRIPDVIRRLSELWKGMDPPEKLVYYQKLQDKIAKQREDEEQKLMADRPVGLDESPVKPLILETVPPQKPLPPGNPDLDPDPASDLKPEPVSQPVSDPVPESSPELASTLQETVAALKQEEDETIDDPSDSSDPQMPAATVLDEVDPDKSVDEKLSVVSLEPAKCDEFGVLSAEPEVDKSPNNAKVSNALCRQSAKPDGGHDGASCMGDLELCGTVGDTNVKDTGVAIMGDEGVRGDDVGEMCTGNDKDKKMCTGDDIGEEMCIADDMDKEMCSGDMREMCSGEGEVGDEMYAGGDMDCYEGVDTSGAAIDMLGDDDDDDNTSIYDEEVDREFSRDAAELGDSDQPPGGSGESLGHNECPSGASGVVEGESGLLIDDADEPQVKQKLSEMVGSVDSGSIVSRPASYQSLSNQPTVNQTASHQPDVSEPVSSPTASNQPSVSQPASNPPAVSQTASQKPAVSQTASQKPAVSQTASQKPAVSQPASQQLAVSQSDSHQPTVSQPAVSSPASHQPAVSQPAVSSPASHQLTVSEQASHQPALRQPASHQPVVSQPASHQPVISQTIPQQPVNRKTPPIPIAMYQLPVMKSILSASNSTIAQQDEAARARKEIIVMCREAKRKAAASDKVIIPIKKSRPVPDAVTLDSRKEMIKAKRREKQREKRRLKAAAAAAQSGAPDTDHKAKRSCGTPYFLTFMSEKFKEVRTLLATEQGVPEKNIRVVHVTSYLSKVWKGMGDEEKQGYLVKCREKRTEKEKMKRDQEKAAEASLSASTSGDTAGGEASSQSTSATDSIPAKKKSAGVFPHFTRQHFKATRERLSQQQGIPVRAVKITEVARHLSIMWKQMTPKQRSSYTKDYLAIHNIHNAPNPRGKRQTSRAFVRNVKSASARIQTVSQGVRGQGQTKLVGPTFMNFMHVHYKDTREAIAKETKVPPSRVRLPQVTKRLSAMWHGLDESQKDLYRKEPHDGAAGQCGAGHLRLRVHSRRSRMIKHVQTCNCCQPGSSGHHHQHDHGSQTQQQAGLVQMVSEDIDVKHPYDQTPVLPPIDTATTTPPSTPVPQTPHEPRRDKHWKAVKEMEDIQERRGELQERRHLAKLHRQRLRDKRASLEQNVPTGQNPEVTSPDIIKHERDLVPRSPRRSPKTFQNEVKSRSPRSRVQGIAKTSVETLGPFADQHAYLEEPITSSSSAMKQE